MITEVTDGSSFLSDFQWILSSKRDRSHFICAKLVLILKNDNEWNKIKYSKSFTRMTYGELWNYGIVSQFFLSQ